MMSNIYKCPPIFSERTRFRYSAYKDSIIFNEEITVSRCFRYYAEYFNLWVDNDYQ